MERHVQKHGWCLYPQHECANIKKYSTSPNQAIDNLDLPPTIDPIWLFLQNPKLKIYIIHLLNLVHKIDSRLEIISLDRSIIISVEWVLFCKWCRSCFWNEFLLVSQQRDITANGQKMCVRIFYILYNIII